MQKILVAAFLCSFAVSAQAAEPKAPLQQLPNSGTWLNPCSITSIRVTSETIRAGDSQTISPSGVTTTVPTAISTERKVWSVFVTDYDSQASNESILAEDQADAERIRDQIAALRNSPACAGKHK